MNRRTHIYSKNCYIDAKSTKISNNKVTQSDANLTDKKKWLINMFSRQLTHIVSDLLVKGLYFLISSKTLPNEDMIATIEDAVKDLEKEVMGIFVYKEVTSNDCIISSSSMGADIVENYGRILGVVNFIFDIVSSFWF